MFFGLVLMDKFLKIRVMLGDGTCKNVMRCISLLWSLGQETILFLPDLGLPPTIVETWPLPHSAHCLTFYCLCYKLGHLRRSRLYQRL